VQAAVCSPPYFWKRRYTDLPSSVWGGDASCEHIWAEGSYLQKGKNADRSPGHIQASNPGSLGREAPVEHAFCQHCAAWKGTLGNEPRSEMFVQNIAEAFREIWRVLRDDGTLWLNLGDSYAGSNGHLAHHANPGLLGAAARGGDISVPAGDLAGGNLAGIPWRCALALQADGWFLRSAVVWRKLSVLPQSVAGWSWQQHMVLTGHGGSRKRDGLEPSPSEDLSDSNAAKWANCPGCAKCAPNNGLILSRGSWRPTNSYEFVFMLTKQMGAYGDGEAVREPSNTASNLTRLNHEKMYEMQSTFAPGGVLPTEEQRESAFSYLQRMRQDQSKNLPSDAKRTGEGQGGYHSLLSDREWHEGSSAIRRVRKTEESEAALADKRKREGSHSQGQHFGVWESEDAQVLPQPSRADSMESQDCPAPYEPRLSSDIDERRVGEYQENLPRQMRLLWPEDQTPDERSYHSTDERRETYKGQHPPSVPKLQYSKEQPDFTQQPTRNLRDVWTFDSEGHSGPHKAVYPEKLVETCLRASTPEYGCCALCGAPWARILRPSERYQELLHGGGFADDGWQELGGGSLKGQNYPSASADYETIGWKATCGCGTEERAPALVLDPFVGSGTTLVAAQQLGLRAVGCDLSETYLKAAATRLIGVTLPMEMWR